MSESESTPVAPPSLIPPADRGQEPVVRAKLSRVPAPPSTSRSLPPMPAIEPILEKAADARSLRDWDGALEAYKKALFLVDVTDTASQASLYAYVGEVKLAQDKKREAETNFEKALAVSPKHLRSLDSLVMLATDAKEWSRVALFRKKRVEALDDDDEKAAETCRAADVLEQECGEPQKAAELLEASDAARTGDTGVLTRLERLFAALRQWPKLITVLDQLCSASSDPVNRGAYRFAQADVVLGRLREEPRGLAFLELALDEDPQNDRALSALIAVRTRREEWAELAAVYERLIDRFAGLGDRERAWEVCRKLGVLRRDRLLDGPGAIEALRGAVEVRPDDAESRAALAELYAAKGDRTVAVTELEKVATFAPMRAQTYRRLHELHTRAQRPDRAWLVATCLEELGAADVSHELVIEQFRPDGPIRPTTALEEGWWDECLRAGGADPIVCEILLAVSDAAIALRLEELAAKKKLPVLDPATKQDKASTASVVRTFVWAARALGIGAPDLYLLDEVPNGIAAVPAVAPGTALGPQVRSGMTVQQLAFLAGRHLTYYRPEHYALVFFPTLADLSSLVLAAVRLVIPGISVPPPGDGDSRIATELGDRLEAEKKTALEDAVARLDARGGKLDLLTWIRHVELTAARAGLMLAGDLRVPMRMMKDETRAIGELSADTKRGDLIAFCASDAYGKLRERMGVAIHSSTFASGSGPAAAPSGSVPPSSGSPGTSS
ncbi:MAG: domain protein putative component of TonB system [Myxococcaceae bacterium]|nr:domain protein putative component of TonB system [Myxococcaceae bacterium]